MNDRFKFRVWDKEAKRIQYPTSIHNHMGYGEVHNPIWATYEGEDCIETCPPNPGVIEDYIIMQCTGLKDKNGKDIYEGDIVKIEFFEESLPSKKYNYEIEWLLGMFYAKGYKCLRDIFYSQEIQKLEVIGNRYEHPHLLES